MGSGRRRGRAAPATGLAGSRLLLGVALVAAIAACGLALGPGHEPSRSDSAGRASGGDGPPGVRGAPTGAERLLFEVDAVAGAVAGVPAGSAPILIDRRAALGSARTGTVLVALPDGTRYPVRYERGESAPGGNWTFFGRVDTVVGDLAAVITFGPDAVFGLLPTPDGTMLRITTRAGQAFLEPAGGMLPPGVDPSDADDAVVPLKEASPVRMHQRRAGTGMQGAPARQARLAIGQVAATGAQVTIDVLATYTTNLVALRGSASAAQSEFHNLVAVANQAHADSGSHARFAIADFAEIDYPAATPNRDLLYAVQAGDLPDGSDLHGLRDAAAADLVAVIRPHAEDDPTCGIAFLPGNGLEAYALDAANGFSVTAVEACAPLVLAHELGHNIGLMHDRDTVAGGSGVLRYGAFPFSFGYRQDGPPAFATVMAYEVGEQAWINRFSHPGSTLCEGVACGVRDRADNVRSINLTAATIARFRDPSGTISLLDAHVLEPDTDFREGIIEVRLSSPAPAGGITFDLAIEGGSAEWGGDVGLPSYIGLDDWTIPEGGTSERLYLRVLGDGEVESTETLVVRLEDVRGAVAVHDAEATLTILDDDDTVRVSGRLLMPATGALPDEAIVYASQVSGGAGDTLAHRALAPDYRYTFDVARGAAVSLWADLPPPLMARDLVVESVASRTTSMDLPVTKGVMLTGELTFDGPQGAVPAVILWNPMGDGGGYYVNVDDWLGNRTEYAMLALPGVPMQLEVMDPPAPYVPQLVEIPPLEADGAWDIRLREVPSLTIEHSSAVEGDDGVSASALTATLSAPAPEGGLNFDLSFGGSAEWGDFMSRAGTYWIPGGQSSVRITLAIVGDEEREPDETVELLVSNLDEGAWNPGPGSVRILSDDPVSAGGGRCSGSAEWPSVRYCE